MRRIAAPLCIALATPLAAAQGLEVLSAFDPSATGSMCAGSHDSVTDTIWVYTCGGGEVQGYRTDGTLLLSFPMPGGSTNDVDIDVAPVDLAMNGVDVPRGSVLVFNGEVGECEIYAHDAATGDQIVELTAAWGLSHVVGGAYHPDRGTFFLVQDRNGGAQANQIAEIDPADGSVLNTISTIDAGYSVNFGDLEVNLGTGKLTVVSSAESTIAQFTPEGDLVSELPRPSEVGGPAGIGLNGTDGVGWLFAGRVAYQVSGFPLMCAADIDCDGELTLFDFLAFQNLFDAGDPQADFDGDGSLTLFDFLAFQNAFDGGCP